jgi:anti-anti-sigma factor
MPAMRTSTRLLCGQVVLPRFCIRLAQLDAATVEVVVTGEVDLATQHLLLRAIEQARRTAPATLVIDLTGVGFFSVSAVAVLARARAAATASGAAVEVLSSPGAVQRVLRFLQPDVYRQYAASAS